MHTRFRGKVWQELRGILGKAVSSQKDFQLAVSWARPKKEIKSNKIIRNRAVLFVVISG